MSTIRNVGLPLSGLAGGMPIIVPQQAHPGTLLHQTPLVGDDYIFLWAACPVVTSSTNDPILSVAIGNDTNGYVLLDQRPIPQRAGLIHVIPGILLNSGMQLRVYADTASTIRVVGYTHRRLGEDL